MRCSVCVLWRPANQYLRSLYCYVDWLVHSESYFDDYAVEYILIDLKAYFNLESANCYIVIRRALSTSHSSGIGDFPLV